MSFYLVSFIWGCANEAVEEQTIEFDSIEELTIPDMTGIDFEEAFVEMVKNTNYVQLNPIWDANQTAVTRGRTTCPDLYVGGPEVGDNLDLREADGVSWRDECATSAGMQYSGFVYWDIPSFSPNVRASRQLAAGGSVKLYNELLFSFSGEATDTFNTVYDGEELVQWSYSTTVAGTVRGQDAVDEGMAYRSDLSFSASGHQNTSTLSLSGEMYWLRYRVQDRFDTLIASLSMVDPAVHTSDECPDEPVGRVSLRDTGGVWYDLVFTPTNDLEEQICDGCGTLYLRGLETIEYGEVCPDFSTIWPGYNIRIPTNEEFILTIQQLEFAY